MTTALCCLPTWVWLCAFWLVLGSPGVCAAALQWQFDGVLLPILPSLNRSCCHLYFDLCIPWSIYACEWWEGRRERRRGVEKRKTATTTILAVIPEGTPAVHLPFKSFSTDRHSTEAENYKPPMSIETVCLFCLRRQKRVSFNCVLALWKGLNGAAHRCGNYKKQRQGKKRMLLPFQNPAQTTVIRLLRTQFGFICLCPSLKRAEESLTKDLRVQVRWNKTTFRHCGSYTPTLYMSLVKSDFLDLPSACQTRNWRSAVWPLWKVDELWLIHRGVFHGVGMGFFRTSCESVNCSNMFQDVKLVLNEPDDSPIRAKNKCISVQKEQWL